MHTQTTIDAAPRTHVVPAPGTGTHNFTPRSRDSIARHGASSRSLPNQILAYSHNPGTEFAVHPRSHLQLEVTPENMDVKQSRSNDQGNIQVSDIELAENFESMDLDEPVYRPALSHETEGLANDLHNMNLDGSSRPPCWSPESYTPSVRVPKCMSNPSMHSTVSSSGGVRLRGNFIGPGSRDAAFSQGAPPCGNPFGLPADGGFCCGSNAHPSAASNSPPHDASFPFCERVPFPSAVLPFPIGLSHLPPPSGAEKLVFDSEEEERILTTHLRGIL